ncbi:MAG: SpoVG family protein [Pirellulales bacterium]|nr:SpoVG family protein [Pirellulales bacterium]
MDITEVRIKLIEEPGERLQAFCSITLDDSFVIRDLKIIEGPNGPFVAMPSRKLTARCTRCGCKNHLRAAYCNQCGVRLREPQLVRDHEGRAKLYADIAHPINSRCREQLQQRVIQAFQEELERAKLPGYVSSYEDFEHDLEAEAYGDSQQRHDAPETSSPHFRPQRQRDAQASKPSRATNESHPAGPHHPPRYAEPAPPALPRQDDTSFGAGIF